MHNFYELSFCMYVYFSSGVSCEPLSRNVAVCHWWIWTLGWGDPWTTSSGECPLLLHFESEMGAAQDGAWAGRLGPHKAFWMLLQASSDLYHSGTFPVPEEAWALSKLKQLDGPGRLEVAPCKMSSPGTSSSSSPGCGCGFRIGLAPPGARDRVSWLSLRRSDN